MKLLLFSDLHCHRKHCLNIVTLAQQADIVIGAGDFSRQKQGLALTFDHLSPINKPFIIVPGNNEDHAQLQTICQKYAHIHLLHGNGIVLNGMPFFGVGGGIPITPFGDWSYDFSEQEATALLEECPKNGVLITHSPPQGCVDISSTGNRFGSTAIRQTILNKTPRLNVCGHIHGSAGKTTTLGKTTVINAGPKGRWHTL